jgi:hypothetical protein
LTISATRLLTCTKQLSSLIGCIIESLDVTRISGVSMQIDGSGRVQLVQAMPVLRPDEQVLQMMLDGWRNQQLSRNLQFATMRLAAQGA